MYFMCVWGYVCVGGGEIRAEARMHPDSLSEQQVCAGAGTETRGLAGAGADGSKGKLLFQIRETSAASEM